MKIKTILRALVAALLFGIFVATPSCGDDDDTGGADSGSPDSLGLTTTTK